MNFPDFNLAIWFDSLGPNWRQFYIGLAVTVLGMLIGTLVISAVKNVNPKKGVVMATQFAWKVLRWFADEVVRFLNRLIKWAIRDAVVQIIRHERTLALVQDSRDILSSDSAKNTYMEIPDPTFVLDTKGTIAIWGRVTKEHIDGKSGENKYLISHANIKHSSRKDGLGNFYPNTLAIGNMAGKRRYWRAFMNNSLGDVEESRIELFSELSEGWHLFVLQWDKRSRLFKFSIDLSPQQTEEIELRATPEKLEGPLCFGKWASNYPGHFFDSELGPYSIWSWYLSEKELKDYQMRSRRFLR